MFFQHILYTKKEVSEILKMSTRNLDRLLENSDFPRPIKIGKSNRWTNSQISDFVISKLNSIS